MFKNIWTEKYKFQINVSLSSLAMPTHLSLLQHQAKGWRLFLPLNNTDTFIHFCHTSVPLSSRLQCLRYCRLVFWKSIVCGNLNHVRTTWTCKSVSSSWKTVALWGSAFWSHGVHGTQLRLEAAPLAANLTCQKHQKWTTKVQWQRTIAGKDPWTSFCPLLSAGCV